MYHLNFFFGAPSCVPATTFETAGAELNSDDIEKLLQRDEIKYLTEMMNFPGVLNGDEEVMKKIKAAKKYGKPKLLILKKMLLKIGAKCPSIS